MHSPRTPWFVAAAGLLAAVSACSSSSKSGSSHSSTVSGVTTTTSGHAGTTVANILTVSHPTITWNGTSFSPGTLKVKPGTVVKVVDDATTEVQLVPDGGSTFGTGTMVHRESDLILAPAKSGTYHFHAASRPSAKGTLVVSS